VPNHRQQVDAQLVHGHRDLADALGSVAVHQHPAGMGDLGQLPDGLDGAGLAVGVLDADQHGASADRRLQGGGVNLAVVVDRQGGEVEAVPLDEGAAGLEDGGMLGGLSDDVVAAATAGQRHPVDGQGVGLGAAAGEDDLAGGAIEQVGQALAGRHHRLAGSVGVGVGAGGVAEVGLQVGQGRRHHGRVDRGGGVVVQVDRPADQARMWPHQTPPSCT
jgi:hypothetical protein